MNTMFDIYKLFKKDDTASIKQLSENQLLNIASDINSIFSETNLINSKPELSLPRLVVVGTQSSGKSSILNSIISMDILPTGKCMVTRTPLDIRLHKIINKKDSWIEISTYDYNDENNLDKIRTKLPLTTPIPTPKEVEDIRNVITIKTNELAGDGMDISSKPIIIDIYSPYVPNLSLIDLPGLTMVPQLDKGQPENIKEKIEELISTYIKQERTIIIAIMSARSDLETDLGLHLVKKYDSCGQRTIGVLTKPDLMSSGEHIGNYLLNNISKNLMLTYGYYVVRGRSSEEMKKFNIIESLKIEKEYFTSHSEYCKSVYKDRIGSSNLTNDISKILVNSISELIPSVMTEIQHLERNVNKKLDILGNDLPVTKEGKISVLNKYVSNFNSKFTDSIQSRGTSLNTGKIIKDVFIKFREDLMNIHPFLNSNTYNQEYFETVISSFEGNHMSFYIPPVQLLEACMKDDKLRPILNLREPALKCVDTICDTVIELIQNIPKHEELMQFPPLAKHITTIIVERTITDLKMKTKLKVHDAFKDQESYIWTDDEEFKNILKKISTNLDIGNIIELLESYFKSIKIIIRDIVPKMIMNTIISEIENGLLLFLIQNVVNEDNIVLLKEDDEIEKQRTYYTDLKERIAAIKKIFNGNN